MNDRKMRIRGIQYWQGRILAEMSKPIEDRYVRPLSKPRNKDEEDNFQIAKELLIRSSQMLSYKSKDDYVDYKLVA